MPRITQAKRSRKRLLDEGLASFLRQGYHGTGLKQVLDRVNIPKGSFYNYFESKESFGAEVIRFYADCLGQKLADALAQEPDPLRGLHRFFREQMEAFREADFVGGCLIANLGGELEGSETCRKALATALLGWRDSVQAALAEAQQMGLVRSDIDALELADMLIEAWEGAVIRMKIEQSLEPLEKCVHRLLDGYFQP